MVVDERKLKQIIYNLLSTAVKFTTDGGEVLIEATKVHCSVRNGLRFNDAKYLKIIEKDNKNDGVGYKEKSQFVKVTVSDTGIGFEKGDYERIFNFLTAFV